LPSPLKRGCFINFRRSRAHRQVSLPLSPGLGQRLPLTTFTILFKISKLHHRRKPHSKTKGNKTVEYGFKGTQAWGRAQHRLCVQSPVLCSYLPDGPKCFEVSGLRKMNSFSMLSSCLQILPPSREFVSL
jgi:hypothetical protein